MQLEEFLPKLDWVQASTFPEPRNTNMAAEDECLFIYDDVSGRHIDKAESFNHQSKTEGIEYGEAWYKWTFGDFEVPEKILAYAFIDWPQKS